MQEERQQRLREHARRLIAETRAKSISLDSPSSPIKSVTQRITLSPERTISPINNMEFIYRSKENSPIRSGSMSPIYNRGDRITPPRDSPLKAGIDRENNCSSPRNEKNGNSPLQSFNSVLDRISPQREKKLDKMSYIQSELDALECEQKAVDLKASALETKLRDVMGGKQSKFLQKKSFGSLFEHGIHFCIIFLLQRIQMRLRSSCFLSGLL